MMTAPLVPAVPALLVLNRIDPLLVDEPTPVRIETRPPDDMDDKPADRTISPPEPLLPVPTVKYNDPPRPLAAVPEPKYIEPLLPKLVDPEPTTMAPVVSALEVPVDRTSIPLLPFVPPAGVLNRRFPLLYIELTPLVIDIRPPVAPDEPADNTSSPPNPLFPDPTVT